LLGVTVQCKRLMQTRTGRITTMAPNASKDHCPRQHPYDEVNTYLRPNGGRGCKACRRAQSRAFEQRKRITQAGAFDA
jgi:hypothetical protein